MKKIIHLLLIAIVMTCLNSCALMRNGRTQSISFSSSPAGAIVRDIDSGKILCVTPCRADVARASTRIFSFEKEGYRTTTQVLHGTINPNVYWNLLYILPTFLLLTPLIAVDFGTGAAWRYNNPTVNARLIPDGR